MISPFRPCVASLLWLAMQGIDDCSLTFPKMVLLDRDGVINEDVGSPGIISPSQFRLTEKAASAIGRLRRRGCKVVLVTNQSCVGKGLISTQELDEIHNHMKKELLLQDPNASLDRVYFCTSNKAQHPSRKPSPGMLIQAMRDYDIGPSECVMIGDTITDMQAAVASKVSCRILVSTGYGFSIMGVKPPFDDANFIAMNHPCTKNGFIPESILPFLYVRNLNTAVDYLLKGST